MKLAYLTEIAALMAAHNRLFIEQVPELPNHVIGDYYILSRNRFNRWMHELHELEVGTVQLTESAVRSSGSLRPAPQSLMRGLAQQVMINDMLARIWTVLLVARDVAHHRDRVRPVAHNVFLGHLAIRHKCLSCCLTSQHLTVSDVKAVDRLRGSIERWTDMLCCQVMDEYDLWQYAYDRERAQDFLRDRREHGIAGGAGQAWVLILTGMRHSFPDVGQLGVRIPEDDRAIAQLMLNTFPEDSPEMTFWMGSRLRRARIE